MNVTYNQNYMFPAFYALPGYTGYQYPYNVYAMSGVYVPACPEVPTPGVFDPAVPTSSHCSTSFSPISSEESDNPSDISQTSPLRNDIKPFTVHDETARPACVFEEISNHGVSQDCAVNTVYADNQRRCSIRSSSPPHQLRLPSITVSSNMAANVMSEECDLGYCSFDTDMTPLPDLKDVADVASLNEILDAQSTFSDIIDDVLECMDSNSSSQHGNSMASEGFHMNDFKWDLPITVQSTSNSDEFTDKVSQRDSPVHQPKLTCELNTNVTTIPRNQSTHKCAECDKTFENQSSLAAHARLHKRERPHRCGYCNKSFTQKSTLRTHVRTHTGERPYSCTYCTRAFSDYSTYRKHVRVHTGERPYTCDVCGRGFTQSGNMIRHRQMHDKPRK